MTPLDEEQPLTHLELGMLYAGGDLDGQEQADYEAHLATCAECQVAVAKARRLIPMTRLALTAKHTVAEVTAQFEKKVAERERARARRRATTVWAIAAVALVGLGVAAGASLLLKPPGTPRPTVMYAPPP